MEMSNHAKNLHFVGWNFLNLSMYWAQNFIKYSNSANSKIWFFYIGWRAFNRNITTTLLFYLPAGKNIYCTSDLEVFRTCLYRVSQKNLGLRNS